MAHVHETPVVVQESDRSGEGMGLGMVLGLILAVMFVLGMAWFFFGARTPTTDAPPVNNNPTININPPSIQVPDNITVNPPAQQPQQPGSGQ
jgi:hypothetical protein